jgi:carbamate kinase
MRVLLSLGGNALLQRDEVAPAANRRRNVELAARALAPVAADHEVILTHSCEQAEAHKLELALRNALPDRDIASVLTQVVIAADDPAVGTPAKAMPHAIAGIRSLRVLLDAGALVISAAHHRMPVALDRTGTMHDVEARVDEDLTAALLARRLDADLLVLLSEGEPLASTLMAARRFAEATGRRAAIGPLFDVVRVVQGAAGAQIERTVPEAPIAAMRRPGR